MSAQKIPFEDFVKLIRLMHDVHWSDRLLNGILTVKDEECARLATQLLAEEQQVDYPANVDEGDPDNISVGDTLKLSFQHPRPGLGTLFQDTDTLYQRLTNTGTLPSEWYLVDQDHASWEPEQQITAKLATIEQFIEAIEGDGAIWDSRANRLVFTRQRRFDVSIVYTEDYLKMFGVEDAQYLIEQLQQEDGHSGHRHEICVTAVCDMLATVPQTQRFGHLLSHMEELKRRFDDGYRLFTSAFSFEVVRDQAEALKIEYLGKIHKTITDIQGQLLGIPTANIVVATQLKSAGANYTAAMQPSYLWTNLALIVSALVFCILFSFSACNQFSTLNAINDEMKRHKDQLDIEHADIKGKIEKIFTSLKTRINLQFGLIAGALAICWAAFLFSAFVAFLVTPPTP